MLNRIKTILSNQLASVEAQAANAPLSSEGLATLAELVSMICTVEKTELEIERKRPKQKPRPEGSHLTDEQLLKKHKRSAGAPSKIKRV